MLGGKTKGVLVTASAAPFRFTPHQVQLIRLLAAQIAIAIEHALLYDELERERTAREGALREANEGLERLNQLKDDFLSVASHELKTPITSIKVFSELAGRRPEAVNPQIMRMLGRQADRLVAMINNLLDVSRLQLDRLTVDMQPVDLSALAHDYCERYAFLLEGHVVSCIARQAPLMVNADPMRLEEVFSNLLDNAVKYSAKGSRIRLEMGRTDATARLLVQDEGIGIPAEHLPHLFERFYKPSSQGYPGLGLGLYICKEIVERHGGRIWAESEGEGKGATFYVELPLAQEQ
jgi:signal transduction histidine kinase